MEGKEKLLLSQKRLHATKKLPLLQHYECVAYLKTIHS